MFKTLLGTKIDHFRFIDKIATGGMGEVFLGYDEALQRKVVLKCIRPEFQLDKDAKGRFLREARVLSQLGHPNICQIYDYIEGETSDFIVMEFVEGINLNKAMKKGIDERTKMHIAEQIAGVLVSAHEKGIVHRDLKPENVMLTEGNQVKVLDFGLSRKISEEITAPLLESESSRNEEFSTSPLSSDSYEKLTRFGTIMGTLSYMSPEQARGEVATAASDMYSFGLILQELFTGKSCYEQGMNADEHLEKAKKGETLTVTGIDSDLKTLIERLKSIAPSSRPSALDTKEKLEWIRHKPTRLRKRLLSAFAILVLICFSIAMTVESIRATKAEKRAKSEAETSKQVSDFLVNLFKVSNPSEAKGKSITARELLDAGAKKVEKELKNQPLVQATLMETMGNTYIGLGLYNEALPLLENSLTIREKYLKPDDLLIARSLNSLGLLYHNQGKYSDAEPPFMRSLEIREKILGYNHPEIAQTLNNIVLLYLDEGKYPDAENYAKSSLEITEKALGSDSLDVSISLNNLANLYYNEGRYPEAEPIYKRSLAIKEKNLGADNLDIATTLNNIANLYDVEGKYSEAEPLYKRSLEIREKILGPTHPEVATSLNNMAILYKHQGKYSQAEQLYKQCLEIWEKALGPDHPDVATALNNLAILYCRQGKYNEAEPLYKRSLEITEKAVGSNHPDVALSLDNLANLYRDQKKYSEAEPLYKRALKMEEESLDPFHPDIAISLHNLAILYYEQGKYSDAEPLFKRSLQIYEKSLGPDHPYVAENLEYNAKLLRKTGRIEEAEKCEKRAKEISNKQKGT